MLTFDIGMGTNGSPGPIVWKANEVINPHILLTGGPGCGKSHQLRRLVTQLARQTGIRIFLFDPHGDLELPANICSTVKFSETTNHGINPLKIDPDPDTGGVRRKVATFISMIKRYSARSLGDKQINMLTHLLFEFYLFHGYHPDKTSTWRNDQGRRVPEFSDLRDFVKQKLSSFVLGRSSDTHKRFQALTRKLRALSENDKLINQDDEEAIDKLKTSCIESFSNFLDTLENGREIDQCINFESIDVLKSVYTRIENLSYCGAFQAKRPAFDRKLPVWRFDIVSLSKDAKGYLVENYLEKIYQTVKNDTLKAKALSAEPTTFAIVDEAHLFLDLDPDHIINKFVRELRKYRTGLVLASQSYNDFTEQIIVSCATKLILGSDDHPERFARIFGVKTARIQAIQPKKTALVQLKRDGISSSNTFIDVVL